MRNVILYSSKFKKGYGKLSETEKTQTKNKVKILINNPYHPSLRVKRIKGSKGYFECSVNMDIRIIWCFLENNRLLLMDIGHHDVLKRIGNWN